MTARLVVSVGCPSGIGPEVSLSAAAKTKSRVCLVGDEGQLGRAATIVRVARRRLVRVDSVAEAWGVRKDEIAIFQPTASLSRADRDKTAAAIRPESKRSAIPTSVAAGASR